MVHPLDLAAAFVCIALWWTAVLLGALGYRDAAGVLILIAMLLPIGAATIIYIITGKWPVQ